MPHSWGLRTIRNTAILIISIILLCGLAALVIAGVFDQTQHGGVDTEAPDDGYVLSPGSCSGGSGATYKCHSQHYSQNDTPPPPGGGPFDYMLVRQNNNTFCTNCHVDSDTGTTPDQPPREGSWTGLTDYDDPSSAHGNASVTNPDTGFALDLCLGCHDPHGRGTSSPYDALTAGDEEAACTACHDASGPASTDIASQLTKLTDHLMDSTTTTNRHSPDEAEGVPVSTDYDNSNRHAECPDCHNPHRAASGNHSSPGNDAGNVIKYVSYIEVTNWDTPSYVAHPSDDATPTPKEYQLCLKCHSSWAYGASPPNPPSGGTGTDQRAEFNTANASYHPVAGLISSNDYTIPTTADGCNCTMEPPWNPAGDCSTTPPCDTESHKLMTCTDCHASDTDETDPRGPHGSTNLFLLRASMVAEDIGDGYYTPLCVKCHKYSVYVQGGAGSRLDVDHDRGQHMIYGTAGNGGCRSCHGNHENGTFHGSNYTWPPSSTPATRFLNNQTNFIDWSPGNCDTQGCKSHSKTY